MFGEQKTRVGLALAMYMEELPANPLRIGIAFCDEDNAPNLVFYVLPTGAIQAYRGGIPETINTFTGTLLGTSSVAQIST